MSDSKCGCCQDCLAKLPDHWLVDFWRYCPHRLTMSKRRARADPWTIERNVTPENASIHLVAAVQKMNSYAVAHGLELSDLDAMLTAYRLRLRDPDHEPT